jgi:hypothetical protein
LKYLSLFLPKKNQLAKQTNSNSIQKLSTQLSTTTLNNNFQQKLTKKMAQICVGGLAYEKDFFTIRVAENYANTPSAPEIKDVKATEAVLHKLGAPWNLERISIHMRDGSVFTGENALRNYLLAQGVKVFFHPTTYVEVFVPCSSSYWKSWDQFEANSTLADGAPILLVPQSLEKPDVLPRPFELMLATYEIRHCTNTAPGLCETRKRSGTLTFQDSDNHYIKDELGQHYFSLAQWHLKNPTATEEDIAKDLATNGSPWSHIDVKVGDEWITGCTFLALRHPAEPGDDGPVPRQNAESVLADTEEEEPDAVPDSMSGPVPRAMTDYPGMDEPYRIRVTTNETLTGVIRRNGDFQSPYTKQTYSDYEIELDQEVRMEDYTTKYLSSIDELALFYDFDVTAGGEAWIYVEIEVDGVWMRGDEAALELFNIKVEKDKNGIWGEVLGPRRHLVEYDAQEFDEALSNRVELNLTVTEVIQKFGPGIPVGYTFDPDYFVENYEKHFTNPEQYWEEMSHEEAMYCFGPRESRPTLNELEEMDPEITQCPRTHRYLYPCQC